MCAARCETDSIGPRARAKCRSGADYTAGEYCAGAEYRSLRHRGTVQFGKQHTEDQSVALHARKEAFCACLAAILGRQGSGSLRGTCEWGECQLLPGGCLV
ncbi:hypothetical protein NDU88_001386 [Pleurodeles waltl]|uniref:Uncharacterized protein n=1 Tax=Pleurodeles waltl TaxID=8319 RepID=A0AAV7VBR4_PLEWA|nr:hypothetical protein NDU88_001386 [Pleurodeles waltl]